MSHNMIFSFFDSNGCLIPHNGKNEFNGIASSTMGCNAEVSDFRWGSTFFPAPKDKGHFQIGLEYSVPCIAFTIPRELLTYAEIKKNAHYDLPQINDEVPIRTIILVNVKLRNILKHNAELNVNFLGVSHASEYEILETIEGKIYVRKFHCEFDNKAKSISIHRISNNFAGFSSLCAQFPFLRNINMPRVTESTLLSLGQYFPVMVSMNDATTQTESEAVIQTHADVYSQTVPHPDIDLYGMPGRTPSIPIPISAPELAPATTMAFTGASSVTKFVEIPSSKVTKSTIRSMPYNLSAKHNVFSNLIKIFLPH